MSDALFGEWLAIALLVCAVGVGIWLWWVVHHDDT